MHFDITPKCYEAYFIEINTGIDVSESVSD